MIEEELRQALDDAVLMHTGRSIGDVASQRVLDDIMPHIISLAVAKNAAMREIVAAVAKLEEDWIGSDEIGGHGYHDYDVGPLVERARATLGKKN